MYGCDANFGLFGNIFDDKMIGLMAKDKGILRIDFFFYFCDFLLKFSHGKIHFSSMT